MSEPGVVPPSFASTTNYDATSNLPAGAEDLEGTPTRLSPPTSFWQFGLVPGRSLRGQWLNYLLGLLSDWVRWVSEATSALARSAHLVKTDSNGKTRLFYLVLGDGSGGALTADTALTIVADGTKRGIDVSNGDPTSLQLFRGISSSSAADCAYFETSNATKHGVHGVAVGGRGIYGSASGAGTGVYGTSVDGYGVFGSSTAASLPGVWGQGDWAGVYGSATADTANGVTGATTGTAASSASAVRAVAFADATGLKATAAEGNAGSFSNTGAQDTVAILANGDDAALRLDPRSSLPATDRAGQVTPLEIDTGLTQMMWCGNATGLAQAQRYIWGGFFPLLSYMEEDDSIQTFTQGSTNQTVLDVIVPNPYAVNVTVRIRARVTVENDSTAGTPISTFSLHLFDVTASTTPETDSFDLATATSRIGATIEEKYSLPAATTTTIRLRVSVGAGTGGNNIKLSHAKLSVETVGGALV